MNSTLVAHILLIGYIFLVFITFIFGVKKRGRKLFIAFLYFLAISYSVSQGLYYAYTHGGESPDESAHISYIYYLESTGKIIPDFEDMGMFSNTIMKWSEDYYAYDATEINNLCHPPLYYNIMRLAGDCFFDTEDPAVIQINKTRLRLFSLLIYTIGLFLLLYIGWSRINRSKPWLHLLYCTAATSIPMLGFEMCAVTNDSLALVTSCICIIGLIRFSEGRRNYLTYLLINIGITASLLTKLTAALLCIIMALIMLVYKMISERSVKKSLPFEFWVSAPLLLIAFAYFAITYKHYGTIQPSLELVSSTDYFQSTIYYTAPEDRVQLTPKEYLNYYINRFFLSWSGIEGLNSYKKLSIFSKASLPSELLWIFPIMILLPRVRTITKSIPLPVFSGWVACVITFIIQLKSAYGTYLTRGYLGGCQARYYLPFLFAFAMGAVFLFQSLLIDNGFDSDTELITIRDAKTYGRKLLYNHMIYFMALIYSFLLFYGNFPFFLMHFT